MTFEPSIATNEDITMSEENADTQRYTAFFGEINYLVEETKRQYGVGNRTYTEYIIERLQYAKSVCRDLLENMRGVLHLEDYSESVNDLIDCLILQTQQCDYISLHLQIIITVRFLRQKI